MSNIIQINKNRVGREAIDDEGWGIENSIVLSDEKILLPKFNGYSLLVLSYNPFKGSEPIEIHMSREEVKNLLSLIEGDKND